MSITANITPEVLCWARNTSGYSVDNVVEKLNQRRVNTQTVFDWEQGIKKPTYTQLEKLAKFYKRPLAVFFFPNPPQEDTVAEKFRTLPENYIQTLSPRICFLVRKATARQLDLKELKEEGRVDNHLKMLQNKYSNAEELAKQIRNTINSPIEQQFEWKKGDHDNALKIWRGKLESLGIWIFKDSFQEEDYCGFYLPDQNFPIIYLNNNIPKSRQIFTLFHEFGHFLLSKGGIDFRSNIENQLTSRHKQEEVFCNTFAGAFLVPDDSLEINGVINDKTIKNYADKYKVSREVILRKYLNRNLIDNTTYTKKVNQWRDEYNEYKNKKDKENNKNSGNYYATHNTYLGNKYLELAFSQYYKNRITEYQLANYLGVRLNALPSLEGLMLKESTK